MDGASFTHMPHIAIISSSVRDGRKSHGVALFLQNQLKAHATVTSELLDLLAYDFPIFHERLRLQKEPLAQAVDFGRRIREADGVIIVTPEYNGGYPAALKNAIDLLYDEWRRKPVAVAAVSDGGFGGSQVLTSLGFTLWKIGVLLVPSMLRIPNAGTAFDVAGIPSDKAGAEKRAASFIKELLWCVEATQAMAARKVD